MEGPLWKLNLPSVPGATLGESMILHEGDIYWVDPKQAGYAHPHVVIRQNSIDTIVVCAITTNLQRAKSPGNVLLDAGEANLAKQSAVVVSRVSTVHQDQLGEYIGTLSSERVHQILVGMRFLEKMTEHHFRENE